MRRLWLLLVPLALAAGSCAGIADGDGTPRSPAPAGSASPDLLQATATVLQRGDAPAALCLGGIAQSYPPQCGDVPLTNWSWDAVDGEERAQDVIWGTYHVVGTFDGESFTVVRTGPPEPPPAMPDDEIVAPCPEPPGGWTTEDPAKASEADVERLAPAVRAEPDFAGLWIDYLGDPPPSEFGNAGRIILTVAFTGDLERHRAELRAEWGGPLCVWRHERTMAELERIQAAIHDDVELGLWVLSSSASEVRNVVEVGVVLATDEDRAAVDARYGRGVVVLDSALRPA